MGQLACLQQVAGALFCQRNLGRVAESFHAPCGSCQSCQLMQAGNHPDYIGVSAESAQQPIKVEAIRALKETIEFTPQISPHRLVLIGPIDQLTEGAANALLKSLEEPPLATHFLLFTEHLNKVIPTLGSRCRILRMPQPSLMELVAWLEGLGFEIEDSGQIGLLNDLYSGAPLAIKAALDDQLIEQLRAWSKFLGALGRLSLYDALLESRSWLQKVPAVGLLTWTQLWLSGVIKNKLLKHPVSPLGKPRVEHFFSLFDWISNQKAIISELPQVSHQRLIEQLVIRWHQMSCYTQ